jgi:hypothetical protein
MEMFKASIGDDQMMTGNNDTKMSNNEAFLALLSRTQGDEEEEDL